MLELLTDFDDHRSLSPVASSFRDLWIRATSKMSKEWTLRFAKILQRDVFANFLESQNLRHDINPSISSYIPERRKSGLMESYIVGQHIFKLYDVFVIYIGGGLGGGGNTSKKN